MIPHGDRPLMPHVASVLEARDGIGKAKRLAARRSASPDTGLLGAE